MTTKWIKSTGIRYSRESGARESPEVWEQCNPTVLHAFVL